jgi:hypothetical protein
VVQLNGVTKNPGLKGNFDNVPSVVFAIWLNEDDSDSVEDIRKVEIVSVEELKRMIIAGKV